MRSFIITLSNLIIQDHEKKHRRNLLRLHGDEPEHVEKPELLGALAAEKRRVVYLEWTSECTSASTNF